MAFSMIHLNEFTHTEDLVEHKPSGVKFYRFPTLDVVPETWPTTKRLGNGSEYDLEALKERAKAYLHGYGLMG
jgi:hypothetical protein